jgi:SOS-response transcriptional repressor LexA/DNA-binding XRE family transcriptional regulator
MQRIDTNAIIERIKQLRTCFAGLRGKSKFAKALNISPSTYNYYENNRMPPIEVLLKICEVTCTDLHWLLTGQEGGKKSSSDEHKSYKQQNCLVYSIDNLLNSYPDLAEPISAFVDLLCQKKGVENKIEGKATDVETDRPAWIPVLGRTAAGMVYFWDSQTLPQPSEAVTELDELVKKHIGKEIVGMVDAKISVDLQAKELLNNLKKTDVNLIQVAAKESEEITEFVQCRQIYELFSDSFALRIDGDSMSPRINDGDIVILSPSVAANQGQIGIIRLKNQIGVTCKLIRMTDKDIHLIPINEKYQTKVIPKRELVWALAVLCHISL